jgi:hypothetical protein
MEVRTNTITDQQSSNESAKRVVTGGLHYRVYGMLIGLTLWFVVWVWSFFGAGEIDYLLFIVTGFITVVVALQLILSRVAPAPETTNANTAEDGNQPSFRDWLRGDFAIEHGRLRSIEAAIIILLPIAAAAIGMMTFGIEFQIIEHAGI